MNIGEAAKKKRTDAEDDPLLRVHRVAPPSRTQRQRLPPLQRERPAYPGVHPPFRGTSVSPLDEVGRLLTLWQDRQRASADVKALAAQHVRELNRKIEELSTLRDTLQDLVEHCQGDHRPDCPIPQGPGVWLLPLISSSGQRAVQFFSRRRRR